MRTFIFLLCSTAFGFTSNEVFSQNTKIHIDKDQIVSIDEVFDLLRNQTDYTFIYEENLFKDVPKVNLKKGSIRANKLLEICFSGKDFKLDLKGDKIIIIATEPSNTALQTFTVSGTVMDTDGQPLPGANIIEKGTTNGVTADFDGNFSIDINDENAILMVSYIGYATKEISINGQTNITVSLVESAAGLEEVVVVGYGTQTAKDLTSSVVTVSSEELNQVASTSPLQQLQGRATGVVVSTNSHQPGSNIKIRVRGNGSISANGEPLILVDQLRQDNINAINPADIESMTILKDAAATAIYGAQGANGVILITTKQGARGRTQINYDSYIGFQSVPNKINLINAREDGELLNVYADNAGLEPYFTNVELNDLGVGTNWQDKIFRKGSIIQSHTLSANGGGEKTQFYLSGNYFQQDGAVINSDFERYTVRANVSNKVNDRLKIGINTNISRSVGNAIREGTGPGNNAGPVDAALEFTPILPIFNADGSYTDNESINNLFLIDNPVQLAREFTNKQSINHVFGNLFAELKIMDGLVLKTDLGGGLRNTKTNIYFPIDAFLGQGLGRASINTIENTNWRIFNTLTYKKVFAKKHNFEILLGQEAFESIDERAFASARGFTDDQLQFNNLGQGNGDFDDVNSGFSRRATDSYFARFNYAFKNKYLLNLTARNDGASVFGKDFKRGWFPAGSIGYVVSEELFLQDSSFLSYLKLKASYGISGTPGIAPYQSLALIGQPLSSTSYNFNGQNAPIAGFIQLANPNLKWEESKQLNLGLNASFFNDRVSLSVEYYDKDTEDLILPLPLAPSTGFTSITANTASMNNTGVELGLNANVLDGDFKWDISANAAYNKNEVTDLGEVGEFTVGANVSAIQNANVVLVKKGEALGSFFGLQTNGIYQNQVELDADTPEGATVPYSGAGVGTFRFRDTNGDGLFNDEDRVILGSPLPDWTGGLTNRVEFKNWDFSIFLTFVSGNEILNLRRLSNEGGDIARATPTVRYYENYWRGENTTNSFQRPGVDPNLNKLYDLLLEDGSYIRARDITLGYSFNTAQGVIGDYFSSLRLYLSVQNAFTITNYSGYDPDVNTVSDSATLFNGIDRGAYPNIRTFLFGIKIGL
tara:strand:+ start:22532 stop:25861 length:3330 start_codon:yes stop_codon:yes gene_type:complete